MGVHLDVGDPRKRNVDLNIVPYIDLMSCLTAFLLVAAVWAGVARLTVEPLGRDHGRKRPDPPANVSVLIDRDAIYVGVARSVLEPVRIMRAGGAGDWAALSDALSGFRTELEERGIGTVEVAADSTSDKPVPYDDLVQAMDVAVAAGFTRPGLLAPSSLSWRPVL